MSQAGPLAGSLVRAATEQLQTAGVPSPAHDARELLAYVLGQRLDPWWAQVQLTAQISDQYWDLIKRRSTRVPLQHLTGLAYFGRIEVRVGPGVFIPRPETETMLVWAIEELAERQRDSGRPQLVVELCAGSGAISKSLVVEFGTAADVYAVELSPVAYDWARLNLADTTVDLRLGDMADAFTELDGQVDLVIANPPYVPLDAYDSVAIEARDHDPALALFSGADGLDAIRVVTKTAGRLLRPGGLLAIEHAEVQAASAPAIVVDSRSFGRVRDRLDLTGRPRFVTAVRH